MKQCVKIFRLLLLLVVENRIVGIWIALNWVGDGERQTSVPDRRCQWVCA